MALFRRRRDEPDLEASLEPGDEAADERPADGEPAGSSDARTASTPPDAMRRPLDAGEVGPDADATLTRLDLGALRVPVVPGVEVRVELNEQRQPIAVSLVSPRGGVQLIPFAAPRGEGVWDDVRREIAELVRQGGGSAREVTGPFGPELAATVRQVTPEGREVAQPVRFVGFDGPRWFLRATFSGPAATDRSAADLLEQLVLRVVVVRGGEPMAPRDPLPLRLPPTPHV